MARLRPATSVSMSEETNRASSCMAATCRSRSSAPCNNCFATPASRAAAIAPIRAGALTDVASLPYAAWRSTSCQVVARLSAVEHSRSSRAATPAASAAPMAAASSVVDTSPSATDASRCASASALACASFAAACSKFASSTCSARASVIAALSSPTLTSDRRVGAIRCVSFCIAPACSSTACAACKRSTATPADRASPMARASFNSCASGGEVMESGPQTFVFATCCTSANVVATRTSPTSCSLARTCSTVDSERLLCAASFRIFASTSSCARFALSAGMRATRIWSTTLMSGSVESSQAGWSRWSKKLICSTACGASRDETRSIGCTRPMCAREEASAHGRKQAGGTSSQEGTSVEKSSWDQGSDASSGRCPASVWFAPCRFVSISASCTCSNSLTRIVRPASLISALCTKSQLSRDPRIQAASVLSRCSRSLITPPSDAVLTNSDNCSGDASNVSRCKLVSAGSSGSIIRNPPCPVPGRKPAARLRSRS